MKKVLSLLAVAALVFVSCNKEQSELSIDDIKGHAKIIGNIDYVEGNDSQYGTLTKAAAGVRVAVKISNYSLTGNSYNSGYTVLETRTDNNGHYEISIPATDNGVSVSVKPDDFLGTYRTIDRTSGGNKGSETKMEVIYYVNERSLGTVTPGQIVSGNMSYNYKELK